MPVGNRSTALVALKVYESRTPADRDGRDRNVGHRVGLFGRAGTPRIGSTNGAAQKARRRTNPATQRDELAVR